MNIRRQYRPTKSTHSTIFSAFILCFTLVLLSFSKPALAAWTPIIGIPEPSFGVTEIAPTSPSPWLSSTPGFYYVCPSCPTTDDNSNGYPSLPRATIPNPIPAGSVVELHGQYVGDYTTIYPQGTINAPAFLRGVPADIPTITRYITVQGSYLVIENILSAPSDSSDTIFGFKISEGSHHIAIRNSEFSGVGNTEKAGGISLGSWSYSGNDAATSILLDNLNLHDLGDVDATFDQDKHCIVVNGSVNNLWLVNSEMARCSGDGIQIEAQQGKRDKIHHIYVGNNVSHDNKQTGMWVKHATDVIFSQNIIYEHRPSDSSPGAGTGFQYGPEYVWFLFNKIYSNSIGILIASNDPPGDGTEMFIIGNTISNIHTSDDPTNPYISGAMTIRGSTNRYILNNTIYNVDSGINLLADSGKYILYNNIIANRTNDINDDVYITVPAAENSEFRYNLIHNTTLSYPKIKWNSSTITSFADLYNTKGEGQECTTVDPKFNDPDNRDFTFQIDSPAKQIISFEHQAYNIFQNRYGINLRKQITNSNTMNIGAPKRIPPVANNQAVINQ